MPTDRRHCPMLNKKCIAERCEAWYEDVIEEKRPDGTRVNRLKSACVVLFWNPVYLRGIAHRVDGSQRAIESMRNNEATFMGSVYAAVNNAHQQRKLNGDQGEAAKRISRTAAD